MSGSRGARGRRRSASADLAHLREVLFGDASSSSSSQREIFQKQKREFEERKLKEAIEERRSRANPTLFDYIAEEERLKKEKREREERKMKDDEERKRLEEEEKRMEEEKQKKIEDRKRMKEAAEKKSEKNEDDKEEKDKKEECNVNEKQIKDEEKADNLEKKEDGDKTGRYDESLIIAEKENAVVEDAHDEEEKRMEEEKQKKIEDRKRMKEAAEKKSEKNEDDKEDSSEFFQWVSFSQNISKEEKDKKEECNAHDARLSIRGRRRLAGLAQLREVLDGDASSFSSLSEGESRGWRRLADLALCDSSGGRTHLADLEMKRKIELYREVPDGDAECAICSDEQEKRRHYHYSSNQSRKSRMLYEQRGWKWFCSICFSYEPVEFIPKQTRRVVLTDTSLYGVWRHDLPRSKDLVHFDIESIVGGRIQDLTTALKKGYLTQFPARIEIIVLGGLENIGDGDTADQIIGFMDVMKKAVKDHSDRLGHNPPSYVSFCTLPIAPKYCSLYVPSGPSYEQQAAKEWIPPPTFVNRYQEVKKLNDMIIKKNKEDNRDLQNVRLDYMGVKRPPTGKYQHKWDNKVDAVPWWAEVEVFEKVHFTMNYKLKLVDKISKCFKENAGMSHEE